MDNLNLINVKKKVHQSLKNTGYNNFLLAISGGADSLFLLKIIHELSNEYDILLIEKGKTRSLLPILGKTEELDPERKNIMDIGLWKIYLNEIIEYLYKVLHKNRIIIVDMSCGNIRDELEKTNRELRSIRRTANKERTVYGGKRNTKKKIKRRKYIDIK